MWYYGKWGGSPTSDLQRGLWSPYLHGEADTLSAALWHSSDSTQDLDIFSSKLSSLRELLKEGAHVFSTYFLLAHIF